MKIIGVAGAKMNGKDEFVRGIPGQTRIVRLGFSDELKAIAERLYDLTDAQLRGNLKEVVDPRYGITPREIMQRIGEDARRIDPDVWIRASGKRVAELAASGLPADTICVFADVRHHNEAAFIRGVGTLYRVTRPGVGPNEFSQHESEIHIANLKVDYDVVNDGTIDDLHAKVRALAGSC